MTGMDNAITSEGLAPDQRTSRENGSSLHTWEPRHKPLPGMVLPGGQWSDNWSPKSGQSGGSRYWSGPSSTLNTPSGVKQGEMAIQGL